MYEYGGGPDDSLRHSSVQLTEEDIVSMSTLLVNGKYEDCSKVGSNPFCNLNPAPEVKPPDLFLFVFFSAVLKYLHDLLSCLLVYRTNLTSGKPSMTMKPPRRLESPL